MAVVIDPALRRSSGRVDRLTSPGIRGSAGGNLSFLSCYEYRRFATLNKKHMQRHALFRNIYAYCRLNWHQLHYN